MKEFLFILIQISTNIIQSITGFAGTTLAMPFTITLLGVEDAKAVLTLTVWFVTLTVTLQNLKYINVKKLATMLGFMAVGVILGVWLFEKMNMQILLLFYGLVVMGIGIRKLCFPTVKNMPKAVAYIFLFIAGIMQGMFTSGGAFIVLYAVDAMPEKKEFRATVSTVWTTINVFLIYNMYRKGMFNAYVGKLTLLSIIPVFISIWVGGKLAKKIKQETFLKLVYVLLIISGGVLVFNYFV